MKMRHIISLVALLALAGTLFVSCTKVSEDNPAPPSPTPEGTGYFSFAISLDNPPVTRADGTDPGLTGENGISTMRIIFYNSAGKAVVVEDYNIWIDSDYLVIDPMNSSSEDYYRFGDDNRILIPSGGIADIVIKRNPLELPVQDYQIAVLFNHSFNGKYGGEGNMDIGDKTSASDHLKTVLQTPMNLYKDWMSFYATGAEFDYPNQDNYFKFIDNFLPMIGGFRYYPPSLGGFETDNLYPFMSNADGFVSVRADQLANTTPKTPFQLIEDNAIRVDRAVAKVVLYKGTSLSGNNTNGYTYQGHTVKDVAWVPDILNFSMNPIRVPDKVAPASSSGDAEGKELPGTNRAYRYAKDPNWSDYSCLRGYSSYDLEKEFLYIKSDQVTSIERWNEYTVDVFEKTWNEAKPAVKNNWYYIPENTMTADEQWEDVTTRVLLRCAYAPPTSMTASGTQIALGSSYYVFNGYAFTMGQLLNYLQYPDELPSQLYDLYDVVKDKSVRDQLITIELEDDDLPPPLGRSDAGVTRSASRPWLVNPMLPPVNLTVEEPPASLTINGVSFYKNGINYYAIPIRHFDDAKSPAPMGYGRYGVVRNNVYNITIDSFYGPGFPLIPDPEGPDDKDSNIKATVKVVDWKLQYLEFEF